MTIPDPHCHRCDVRLYEGSRAYRAGAFFFCTLRCRRLFLEGVKA